MVVLINGSFGVGKTTVSRLLVAQIPGGLVFDPEMIGYVLRRLPKFIPLRGGGTDDYQDLLLWRRLTISTTSALSKIKDRMIIVPMAFSNLLCLNQIRSELLRRSIPVQHYCLTAPIDVVRARLEKRGKDLSSSEGEWVSRKAAYCCIVHAGPEFSEQISTDKRSPENIAEDLRNRIILKRTLRDETESG